MFSLRKLFTTKEEYKQYQEAKDFGEETAVNTL